MKFKADKEWWSHFVPSGRHTVSGTWAGRGRGGQRHKDGGLKAKNEASFQPPLLLARGLAAKSGQV